MVNGSAHGTGDAVRIATSGSRPAAKVEDSGGPTVLRPLPGNARQADGASRQLPGSPSLPCSPSGGLVMNARFALRTLLILCRDPRSRAPGPPIPFMRVGYTLRASVVTAGTTTDAVACAERSATHGCSCLEPTRGCYCRRGLPRPREPSARAPDAFHACGLHAACIGCDGRNHDRRCCLCRAQRCPWVQLP